MVHTLLFFSLQNAVCFMILTYMVPVSFTFNIQSVLKFKKIITYLELIETICTKHISKYMFSFLTPQPRWASFSSISSEMTL